MTQIMSHNMTIAECFEWLRHKKIVKTQEDFANLIPANRSTISRAMSGDSRCNTASLIHKANMVVARYMDTPEDTTQREMDTLGAGYEDNLVPIIPYRLYKEREVNIYDYITNPDNIVQRTAPVTQFPTTDCYYFVNDYAMQPHFHPSDVLALKKVATSAPIINGEVYVLNTSELGLIIRYVYDKGETLELVSSLDRYTPFEIPKEQIYSIFRIVGLMRTNI